MERQFDPWQQKAIEIRGGQHLVLAPPGCGKTDILTERVVHAHDAGVAYSDMLCLTFTNRAAKGMAQRIADRTGNPVPDNLYVGNIHRYCSQMLFNLGLVNHNSAIIDEGDVDSIIQEELCKRLDIRSRSTELMRYQHALWQLTLGVRGDLILHGELLHTGAMAKLCDVLGRPFDEDSLADIYKLALSDCFDGFIYDRNYIYNKDIVNKTDALLKSTGKPVITLDSAPHKYFDNIVLPYRPAGYRRRHHCLPR